jgi:type VI secretion system protein ImpH
MGTAHRRPVPAVIERLFREPQRFSFFQAVRLLQRWHDERAATDRQARRYPVGEDHPPLREAVRFRVQPGLSFPASEVARAYQPESSEDDLPPELVVNFMGLVGPMGVLPDQYTALLIQRLKEKDESLRDFLDLFHHRTISMFYRAWEKYRLPVLFERASRQQKTDILTECLYSLVGLGTGGLRGRSRLPDEVMLYYGGHFAHENRPEVSLEAILQDHFDVPVRVTSFHGRWLQLREEDRSRLPWAGEPQGQYCQLGHAIYLGERVWDIRSAFRISLGPLTYTQFCRFMPTGDALAPLAELTRSFVGWELDFDVQTLLLKDEVPPLRLVQDGPVAPRLGWNTWLGTPRRQPAPAAAHEVVSDAVFSPRRARRAWPEPAGQAEPAATWPIRPTAKAHGEALSESFSRLT